MDKKDNKLLLELEKNARISNSQLARKIKVSKQFLGYRITRLLNEGIIKKFVTLLNLETIGINLYADIYIKLTGIKKKEFSSLIKSFIKNPFIGSVDILSGNFDLMLVIGEKNISGLYSLLDEILSPYYKWIFDYQISFRFDTAFFPKSYLNEKIIMQESEFPISTKKQLYKLSNEEIKILRILCNNSRISLIELHKKTHLAINTLRNKIKFLEQKGIITGYSTFIDIKKLGYRIFRGLLKTKVDQESIKKFVSYCAKNPNITLITKKIGTWNLEVKLEVMDESKLMEILSEIREVLSDTLIELNPIEVLEECKEDFEVAFNVLGRS